jgi:hypothetical protein
MARVRLNLYRKERPALFRQGGRGRRVVAATGIALGVLGLTSVGVTSIVAPSALAAALRDPSSLFAQRSPGERGLALLQTKHKKAPPPPAAPAADRAEGPRPEPAPVFALIEPGPNKPPVVYGDQPLSSPEESIPPLADVEFRPPPIDGPGGGGGVTTFIDTPGGGGGGGGGGLVDTDEPSVPEPSVWAMLITGFFAVGWAMRAQRRAARRMAHVVRP